jgi:DNA-binding transcriptional ArsR family regulator
VGPESGLAVVDVDRHGDVDGFMELESLRLPATLTVATGGDGEHLYFVHPQEPLKNLRLGPGVELRCRGYVVAAGSIHPDTGRRYVAAADVPIAPLPQNLIDRARDLAPKDSAADNLLEQEVSRVASAPEGNRNNTLNVAAYTLGGVVAAGMLEHSVVLHKLLRAAIASGLDHGEAEATIASGLGAGLARPWTPRRAITDRDQARDEIGRIALAVEAATFPGRGGETDRAVMQALVSIGLETGGLNVSPSVRRLADLTTYAPRTISSSVRRLHAQGWLRVRWNRRKSGRAHLYRLRTPDGLAGSFTLPLNPGVEGYGSVHLSAKDHSAWRAVGPMKRRVYLALEGLRTEQELALSLDRAPRTVREHLAALVAMGLIERLAPCTYARCPRAIDILDAIAAESGIGKRLDERRFRYRRDRFEGPFATYLIEGEQVIYKGTRKAVSHLTVRHDGSVVNTRTGEVEYEPPSTEEGKEHNNAVPNATGDVDAAHGAAEGDGGGRLLKLDDQRATRGRVGRRGTEALAITPTTVATGGLT